jgi:radical SAM superfamily enzyme YgiQ (UPF0313 family)
MRLGLIAMSGLRVNNPQLAELGLTLPGFIERKEVIASLPSLGLLTLAAITPKNIDVEYIEVDEFSLQSALPGKFDMVAISSFTAQIDEAYALADKFLELGTCVVLGGLHVTALPDEAVSHADAIVIGQAEPVWQALIADFQSGCLRQVYDMREMRWSLEDAPIPRYELLDPKKYNRITLQTQRGCPFHCEFCASSIMLSPTFRYKPVAKIIDELRRIKSIWPRPFIELADDNSFANKNQAKRIVRALAQEDIKWFTETDISVADDDELLLMLADSGCRQLLIGLESPSASSLKGIELKSDWKQRRADEYLDAIERIQRHGISVNGCFVLGLDHHDESIFDNTFDFVRQSGLAEVQITLQTPFPGTALYNRLHQQGRLLTKRFWNKCTLFDVTFTPQQMSVEQLESGFHRLMARLYTTEETSRRKQSFLKRVKHR